MFKINFGARRNLMFLRESKTRKNMINPVKNIIYVIDQQGPKIDSYIINQWQVYSIQTRRSIIINYQLYSPIFSMMNILYKYSSEEN